MFQSRYLQSEVKCKHQKVNRCFSASGFPLHPVVQVDDGDIPGGVCREAARVAAEGRQEDRRGPAGAEQGGDRVLETPPRPAQVPGGLQEEGGEGRLLQKQPATEGGVFFIS